MDANGTHGTHGTGGTGAFPGGGGPRGHVAVGVDGSSLSEAALGEAVGQARRRAVPLEIVHGRPWARPEGAGRGSGASSREGARALVEAAAARAGELAPGLEVLAGVVDVDAGEALVEASRRAALTVVGSRGLGGFTGLLLGSVSLRVAAHAAGPLLVVRGGAGPGGVGRRRGTVVVGVESGADADAVALAFEEAAARGAGLTAVHAWVYHRLSPPGEPLVPSGPPADDMGRIGRAEAVEAERVVDPFRERYPGVRVEVRTVVGSAPHVLVEASREADLLVLAAHRGRGRLAMRLGPVVHALIHHARCPVLVVPVPGRGGRAP
ncbi:universal stress protein [Streptomyces glaucosporus]|uniref:Universal stress protein n=1 Tax=Streptomyces glaucosporus TaxID=284044 RepID=A0ABN3IHQ3_9ACTN